MRSRQALRESGRTRSERMFTFAPRPALREEEGHLRLCAGGHWQAVNSVYGERR